MRAIALSLLILFALPASALPTAGSRGMVATAHPAASEAGAAMLRQGGNAVDAAVAAAFALAVAEPYSSGLGGGGFALVRFGDELAFLDFREVAPHRASRDMFLRDGKPQPELSRDGALGVAVPGAVAGYLEMHERWGKLPRAKVLAPAIRIARDGFVVDERYREYAGFRLDLLRQDPEASRIFLVPGKKGEPAQLPEIGHKIVQRDLAATLEAIAAGGRAPFYKGSIARKLAADMKARGGLVDLEDLSAFSVKKRDPLIGSYLGHAVATAPPPSAGGEVVLTVLNALETLPKDAGWRDPAAMHLYVEAMKRAFADRFLFGDPAFVDVPVKPLVAKERTPLLLRGIGEKSTPAARIGPAEGTKLAGQKGRGAPTDAGMDTTHLCAVDAAGNAVSMTTTVNYAFGAGIVAKGTGVLWNDEMDDFAISPGVPNVYGVVGSEANAVAPGKVPLSSMAPTIVFEGASTDSPIRLVVGSPGGPRIPTTVIQVIWNYFGYGADVEKAIALGRVHHQHQPDVTMVEPFALDEATRAELARRGHTIEQQRPWSNATAIAIDPKTGIRTGAADPRGVGTAVAQ